MQAILLLQLVPTFVLVFFRLAGMMLFAPLFGSTRIPKRVRALLVLVLAMAVTPSVPRAAMPIVSCQRSSGNCTGV